jgi:nitronate monooxygenase
MSWAETALTRLLDVRWPIVQAPMAGGTSTTRLAAAVSEAGGLGSVAGAVLSPDELEAEIREMRALTAKPFAVNLFAPLPPPSGDRVTEWAALVGAEPELPSLPAWSVDDQLDVLAAAEVPILSFTFGIPPLDRFDAITIGTATTVEEAVALERAGVDAVVAQAFEAGGHRGTFLSEPDRALVGSLALVPQVVDAVSVPVIAAGGIMDGRTLAAALTLGAQGVQLGTAFIDSPESGATEEHRAALGDETCLTPVFTGRHARGVRTPIVAELERSGLEPPDFPLARYLFPEPVHLAGQGGALARALPAGELVQILASETEAAIARLGRGPGG